MYLLKARGRLRTLAGERLPPTALAATRPASGFAVVGNGWSVHERFPSDSAIRTHMSADGEATVLRAVGLIGDTSIWRPVFRAVDSRRIRKALDPNDARDLAVLIEREGRKLTKVTSPILREFYSEVFSKLDAQWVDLPPVHREALLRSVLNNMDARFPEEELIDAVNPVVRSSSERIMKKSASGYQKEHGLPRVFSWTDADKATADTIANTSSNYVKTINGQIHDSASKTARSLVAQGTKQGLSSEEIAFGLQKELAGITGRTSLNYWRTVASTYTVRARSWSHLSVMDRAGFSLYRIQAILDEVTTPTCRYLHGKTFRVADGLGTFAKLAALPTQEDIAYVQPWFRVKRDEAGLHSLFIKSKKGPLLSIAKETASGFGQVGATGTWTTGAFGDPASMTALNVGPPPYHGDCRTIMIPVFPAGTPGIRAAA